MDQSNNVEGVVTTPPVKNDELLGVKQPWDEGEQPSPNESIEEGNVVVDDTPKGLPEGFNSVEELAEAYAKLQQPERKEGTINIPEGKEEVNEPTIEENKAESTRQEDTTDTTEGVADRSEERTEFNYDVLQSEYMANGKLSDDSIQRLVDAGLPKVAIEGIISTYEQQQQELVARVGTKEEFEQVMNWATQHLDTKSARAFNDAVSSGDAALAALAIDGINAQYLRENTSDLLRGTGYSSSNVRTESDLQQALRDPKIQNDPQAKQALFDQWMKG